MLAVCETKLMHSASKPITIGCCTDVGSADSVTVCNEHIDKVVGVLPEATDSSTVIGLVWFEVGIPFDTMTNVTNEDGTTNYGPPAAVGRHELDDINAGGTYLALLQLPAPEGEPYAEGDSLGQGARGAVTGRGSPRCCGASKIGKSAPGNEGNSGG